MAFTIVDIIYIIANFVSVMTVRKMIHYFFDADRETLPAENAGYAVYYIFLMIPCFSDPNAVICTIGYAVCAFLIILCCRGSLVRRICVIVYTFSLVFCFDRVFGILFFSGLSAVSPLFCIWEEIASKLALWTFVRFLTSSEEQSAGLAEAFSCSCGILLLTAPALSFCTLTLIMSAESSVFQLMMGMIGILLINLLVFLLYENTVSLRYEKMERKLLAQRAYRSIEQLDLMSSTVESLRIFRHDIINHFMVLQYHIEHGNMEECLRYLKKMEVFCRSEQKIKTDNAVVDSILNYKLEEAQRRGIHVEYDVQIPDRLLLEDFDLTCILGNLMDNAIEAAEKTEEKFIEFRLKYRSRSFFLFDIRNTYSGELIVSDDALVTTKENASDHGLGLKSVEKAIRKYDGSKRFYREYGMFCVTVCLFTEKPGEPDPREERRISEDGEK